MTLMERMSTPPPSAAGSPSTLFAIGTVVAASVASRLFRVAKALAVARLLAPEDYGVSAAIALVLAYAQFLDLGSSVAAFRDLTSAVGRGDGDRGARAAGWMGALKLAGALPVAVGGLAGSFWPGLAPAVRLGLVALPAIAVSSTLLNLVLLHLQALGHSARFSRATTIAAASDLVLCVGFTWLWALPGLLAATALSPVFVLGWAVARGALAAPRPVPGGVLRGYLVAGLPLAALNILDFSLVCVDQLVVLTLLSVRDLGLYNVALVAPEAIRTLGTAAGMVLGPRLLREYARSGGRVAAIEPHTLLPVQLYASALPLPTALLWIVGSSLVARFYVPYAGALRPMLVLLVAINFLVVLGGVTTFLFAIDRHSRNLVILGPAVCFNVAVDVLLIRAGGGLMAVAVGSLLTYFLYALAVLWYVAGHFELGRAGHLRFLAGALLPGIGLGLGLLLLDRLLPDRASWEAVALACALAAALFAPLAGRALRLARRLDRPSA
jgi:O-antigen/teichoic acid export membrane protein